MLSQQPNTTLVVSDNLTVILLPKPKIINNISPELIKSKNYRVVKEDNTDNHSSMIKNVIDKELS